MNERNKLEAYVEKALQHPIVHGFAIHVRHKDSEQLVEAGNLSEKNRFFAASVTKLMVTALMLSLLDEKKIALSDPIVKHVGERLPKRLHTYKGEDYTDRITILQLMSNTSGLPDYFDKALVEKLLNNEDEAWHFEDVMEYVRKKDAHFPPGHKRKVKYCDTNYELLGAIIEAVTGKTFAEVVDERIVQPLGLFESYIYDGREDEKLTNIFYKEREIVLPKYMASIGPQGALVTTAKELNVFLQAFFNGTFFNKNHFDMLYDWKLVFAPGLFFYGVGVSMQPISLLHLKKGLIGHWGQSGAFAFYHPGHDVYMSGTVNQYVGHNKAVRVILRALKDIKKHR